MIEQAQSEANPERLYDAVCGEDRKTKDLI